MSVMIGPVGNALPAKRLSGSIAGSVRRRETRLRDPSTPSVYISSSRCTFFLPSHPLLATDSSLSFVRSFFLSLFLPFDLFASLEYLPDERIRFSVVCVSVDLRSVLARLVETNVKSRATGLARESMRESIWDPWRSGLETNSRLQLVSRLRTSVLRSKLRSAWRSCIDISFTVFFDDTASYCNDRQVAQDNVQYVRPRFSRINNDARIIAWTSVSFYTDNSTMRLVRRTHGIPYRRISSRDIT